MDDLERLKILLYQYILFKGDFYKKLSQDSYMFLRSSKDITSADIHKFYYAQLKAEVFDDFQKEIADILCSFH